MVTLSVGGVSVITARGYGILSKPIDVWTGNTRTGGLGEWQATRCIKNTKHEENNFLFLYMHVIIFGYRCLYARYIRV